MRAVNIGYSALAALLAIDSAHPAKAQGAPGSDAWFTPSPPPAEGATEAPVPAAQPLSLDLPAATLLRPPRVSIPPATAAAPQPAAPAPPRLRVDVGAAFTVRNTANPPVGVSANVVGADPSGGPRVAVAGQSPYALPAEGRTPDREVGIGLTYEIPRADDKTIAITGTFARSSYSPTQPLTESKGTATVRIGF